MIRLSSIALVLLATSFVDASAQSYPSRPITIVIGVPAGSVTDVIARVVTERMKSTLGVNFQEVVHSAQAVNAEVAKPPAIRGGPNGHAQECSSHAERSRGDGSSRSGLRADRSCGGTPIQHHAEDRRQMG